MLDQQFVTFFRECWVNNFFKNIGPTFFENVGPSSSPPMASPEGALLLRLRWKTAAMAAAG
jgi:hypothetical protein